MFRASYRCLSSNKTPFIDTLYGLLSAPHPRWGSRSLSSTRVVRSGHNRWSKIKHDKARVDAKVNKLRSQLSKDIEFASKEGGPDPGANPRLAGVLAAAKKAGFPKASCEAAVARGQGRSPSGVALDAMVIEALHGPTGVAAVIDCLTDNKAKTLQEVREKLKLNEATQAPVSYRFERRGRIQFGGSSSEAQRILSEDEVMEAALSAGALDVDLGSMVAGADALESTGTSVVYTEPGQMAAVADAMTKELGTRPEQMELVWYPQADLVVEAGDGAEWEQLDRLVDQLEDDWAVTGVYLNTR